MPSIAQARRPMARFDYSDDGKQIIAKIMQHGDKFSETEKIADEWIAHIEQEALSARYDPAWVAQFKLEYDAFKKGNELPREGTPIRTWALIKREQVTRLISINITTVEDLAAYPDSGLGTIGLDGRVLRDLARGYMDSNKGGDLMAKELAEAKQALREQGDAIKRLEAKNAELAAAAPEKTLHVPKKAA